jgi:hypothetical protein
MQSDLLSLPDFCREFKLGRSFTDRLLRGHPDGSQGRQADAHPARRCRTVGGQAAFLQVRLKREPRQRSEHRAGAKRHLTPLD